MNILEARHIMLNQLAQKLGLSPGKDLFPDTLPPGIPEGITVAITGIREWHPDCAVECEMEITGIFETETSLITYLEKLRDLLKDGGSGGFLAIRQNGLIRFSAHPGDRMDRKAFVIPLAIAFVLSGTTDK